MIRTVTLQTVSNGTVVTFSEGACATTTWTPSLFFVYDDSVNVLPLVNITSKTITGFTLTGLIDTVQIYGTISDSSVAADDPDLEDNAIVSLAMVKAYIKQVTSTQDDAFLRATINRVSGMIERETSSKVVQQSITGLVVSGTGEDILILPRGYVPITQIGMGGSPALSDIQYRLTPTSSWVDLLTNIGNALINAEVQDSNWIYIYGGYFPEGFQNIRLNFKAGYSTIPTAFIQACIEWVVNIYYESKRGGGRLAVSSATTSIESMSSSASYEGLTDRIRSLLSPFTFSSYDTKNISLYR